MTRAAGAAAADAGPQQARAAAAAARARRARARVAAPRPCRAGSTPWSSTAPAGTPRPPPAPPPASTPRTASPRRPDQRFQPPAPLRVPLTFLPDEGESEPARPSGTSPGRNPGQLSPGRLELLTSSAERCRARPGRLPRPRAEPACTTWSEKTQAAGTPNRAGEGRHPGTGLRHARSQHPGAARSQTAARRAPPVARTPLHKAIRNGTRNSPAPLDKTLLTLVSCGIYPYRSSSRMRVDCRRWYITVATRFSS
jgi:hypothetical protein